VQHKKAKSYNDLILRVILPCLHYAGGLLLCAILVYGHFSVTGSHTSIYDFYSYFRAAQVMHFAPHSLYEDSLYTLSYVPGVAAFLNPPTFAMFLYPLGFFTYPVAYGLWVLLNLVLSFCIHQKIGVLADALQLQHYKNLLRSLTVGIFVWSYVFLMGQASIILCLCVIAFIQALQEEKRNMASFWLALALCIKPQLFVPLVFFLAGYRCYKILLSSVCWSLAFALCSLLLAGYDVWMQYIHHLFTVNHSAGEIYGASFDLMINLRGILYMFLPEELYSWIAGIAFASYLLIIFASAAIGHYAVNKKMDIQAVIPLIFILSWFFSPWLHLQECYVLLPVAIAIMPHLLARKQTYGLILAYAIASFGWHPAIVHNTHRIMLITLLWLSSSIFLWAGRDKKPYGIKSAAKNPSSKRRAH